MGREIEVTEFSGIRPKLSDPECLRPNEYLCSGHYIESERKSELRFRTDSERCPRLGNDCHCDYHCIPAYQVRIAALEAALAAAREETERLRSVFPRILESLGNGAACSTDVSLEFIEQIPDEVRLELAALRSRADDEERAKLVELAEAVMIRHKAFGSDGPDVDLARAVLKVVDKPSKDFPMSHRE
jgi:hypothetical protein